MKIVLLVLLLLTSVKASGEYGFNFLLGGVHFNRDGVAKDYVSGNGLKTVEYNKPLNIYGVGVSYKDYDFLVYNNSFDCITYTLNKRVKLLDDLNINLGLTYGYVEVDAIQIDNGKPVKMTTSNLGNGFSFLPIFEYTFYRGDVDVSLLSTFGLLNISGLTEIDDLASLVIRYNIK